MPRELVRHDNLILETLPEVCQKKGWKFYSRPKRLRGMNEWDNINCGISTPKFNSTFQLQQMPGCCAVLIASFIDPEPYTPENFDEVLKMIEEANYEAGFGSLLMAQVVTRKAIWSICLGRGWYKSDEFINAKSGNSVVYLHKNMNQRGKRNGFEIPV